MADTDGFWHEAGAAECALSIANQFGFFWKTLWDHPQNADLKRLRKSPFVLLEGDRIFIPNKTLRQESGVTEQTHRFKLHSTPALARFRFLREGKPRKNIPYVAEIDGSATRGQTDADGLIKLTVPPGAKQALLRVGSGEDMEVYNLALGGLDPATEESGAQQRLQNLGFDCGPESEDVERALREFQLRQKLTITGKLDKDTQQALLNAHGS